MTSLSSDLRQVVEELRSAPSREACVRRAYDLLVSRYHGDSLKTITRLWQLYPSPINTLWCRLGFLHCTNANRLLRFLLLESGHCLQADIRYRWTVVSVCSPHQYLEVKIEDAWIAIDVWGHVYGVPFGQYAKGFFRKRA